MISYVEVYGFLKPLKEVLEISRSYKKTPRAGEKKNRFFKKYANRKFRRNINDEIVLKHNSYKKNFCYYDICDYEEVGISFEQFYLQKIKHWHIWNRYLNVPYPTKEEAYEEYKRWYLRK